VKTRFIKTGDGLFNYPHFTAIVTTLVHLLINSGDDNGRDDDEAARLVACVEELDSWMASNRLKLNADKILSNVGRDSSAAENRGCWDYPVLVSCASVITLTPSWHLHPMWRE